MTASPSPILELSHVSKQYGALRPLRIEALDVRPGEQIVLIGLDEPAAEVFVNLATGATLPDSGSVAVLGRSTAAISGSADWLATLDRFGIVSERGALLEAMSVLQNLALPFSLEIDPIPSTIRDQAVGLAREAALEPDGWERPAALLAPADRLRLRVARALALNPSILLLEHPSATIPRDAIRTAAHEVRRMATDRGIATIALTMDREFAEASGSRVLTLEPATGRLSEKRFSRIRFWS